MGSERLPGKPLIRLAGRPLIEWVWRRVSGFAMLDACVVATDAEEVKAACEQVGAVAVLTSSMHESGTERTAEVMRMDAYRDYEVVVNVQGDEPLLEESHVRGAVEAVGRGFDIGTVATPLREVAAWRDPSVVKVVRRSNGAALYFSRSPIPFRREGEPSGSLLESDLYLRHVGVYAFTRQALERWVALPVSALEREERLEQLRPLGAGMTIGVEVVESAEGGVDTAEDVRRVEARLREELEAELTRSAER
jgi:3-deoxy-manno-octulosonate cytidylyltransferase (CMP-KDO synthetase)